MIWSWLSNKSWGGRTVRITVFIFPSHITHDEAFLSWKWLNICLLMVSGEIIHYFVLIAHAAFSLPIKHPLSLNCFYLCRWLSTGTGCSGGCGVSSLEISKSHLDVVLRILLWVCPDWARVGPDGPRGPCQLQPVCDSVILSLNPWVFSLLPFQFSPPF